MVLRDRGSEKNKTTYKSVFFQVKIEVTFKSKFRKLYRLNLLHFSIVQ
jgi:hypothetical protein